MGCLTTFIITLILLSLALSILAMVVEGWAVLIVAAAVIAAAVCAYEELDKRLKRIEQHLGLIPEKTTKGDEDDEETAP